MSAPHAGAPGPWSPLGQPTFRALWLAILVGNIGTWIHDVAAAWVMAETTNSPLMVAAVQSATTLPVVVLAIVAELRWGARPSRAQWRISSRSWSRPGPRPSSEQNTSSTAGPCRRRNERR
jgi:hypothetical protein